MLFKLDYIDFIFDDAQVPDSIKALVGRLQIPLLKVAMSDRSFFSSREHPARAFLDAVSRASVSLGKDIDREHPFCVKVKVLINRVLEEFEQDQQVFATLLPEVNALIADQESESDKLADQFRQVAEQEEQSELAEIKGDELVARHRQLPACLPGHPRRRPQRRREQQHHQRRDGEQARKAA